MATLWVSTTQQSSPQHAAVLRRTAYTARSAAEIVERTAEQHWFVEVAFRLLLYGRFQALALSPLDQSNGAGIHLSFSLGACICTHALKFKFDIINNFNNCVEQARKSHNFR
jgi:hypothetical protein